MSPAPATADVDPGRASPCILVVDDDPLSRSLLARLLGLLFNRARPLNRPANALGAVFAGGVDAMLLDLSMPGTDGFALLSRLRAEETQRGRIPLPVIAVTGYASPADRLRCLMAGFDDHLSKPIEAGELAAALKRHLPAAGERRAPENDAQRVLVLATAQRLAQARPSDARFAPTLLETFAMRSGQLIEEIARAHDQRSGAGLRHAVKSLRSSAEFMGATRLAALCDRLQAAAGVTDLSRVDTLVRSLHEEHQIVLTVLLRGKDESMSVG